MTGFSIELRTLAFHPAQDPRPVRPSTGSEQGRLASIAAVGVAARPLEGEAKMLAERFDRVGVVDIWVGVRHADDDRPEAPVVAAAGRKHGGNQRIAFILSLIHI